MLSIFATRFRVEDTISIALLKYHYSESKVSIKGNSRVW